MSYNIYRIDENYLQRFIDDLQQDHNNLFNSLKNGINEKEKTKLKNKKVDKHTQLIAKLMNSALLLKQLLEEVKKIK
jgi:ribosomal protein L16 Arg81 hydroxylase